MNASPADPRFADEASKPSPDAPPAASGAASALAGGLAGGMIDRKKQDTFWRERFATLPYAEPGQTFEQYEPAFHAGYEMYERDPRGEKSDAEWERELRELYETDETALALKWERTIEAARAAYRDLRRARTQPLSPENKPGTPAPDAERQIVAERLGQGPD